MTPPRAVHSNTPRQHKTGTSSFGMDITFDYSLSSHFFLWELELCALRNGGKLICIGTARMSLGAGAKTERYTKHFIFTESETLGISNSKTQQSQIALIPDVGNAFSDYSDMLWKANRIQWTRLNSNVFHVPAKYVVLNNTPTSNFLTSRHFGTYHKIKCQQNHACENAPVFSCTNVV